MAVLIRNRPEGMDQSMYDEMAPPLIEKLKAQPGFILHTAFVENGKFTVAEVWESQEQHDRWVDEYVRPHLPGEVEQEVIELHNFLVA